MYGVDLTAKLIVSCCIVYNAATDIEFRILVCGKIAKRLEFITLYGVSSTALERTIYIYRERLLRLVNDINYLVISATREGEISVSKLVTVCRRGQVNGVTTVKAETNVGRICLSCSSNPLRRVGSTH